MEQLVKRLKSLAWRASAVALVAFLGTVAENLSTLDIPEIYIVVIGLMIGEVTKYLNRTKK